MIHIDRNKSIYQMDGDMVSVLTDVTYAIIQMAVVYSEVNKTTLEKALVAITDMIRDNAVTSVKEFPLNRGEGAPYEQ